MKKVKIPLYDQIARFHHWEKDLTRSRWGEIIMINVTDYIDIAEKVRVIFIDGAYTGGGNPTITASPVGRFRREYETFSVNKIFYEMR